MITGGTGSFGNAVLNKFLKLDLKEIRIFIRDEKKFADLEKTDEGLKLTPTGNVDETPDENVLVLLSRKPMTEDEIDKEGLALLKGRQVLSTKEEVSRIFTLTDEGQNFDVADVDITTPKFGGEEIPF